MSSCVPGFATATGALGVGVLKHELRAEVIFDEVHRGAKDLDDGFGVDPYLGPVPEREIEKVREIVLVRRDREGERDGHQQAVRRGARCRRLSPCACQGVHGSRGRTLITP